MGDHVNTKDTKDFENTKGSRRDFMRKAGTAAAGLLMAPYVRPSGVLAYSHGRASPPPATVAIANTTAAPADGYIYDDAGGGVRQRVKYLLDLVDQNQAGGVAALFGKGKKVAIKINLTGGSGSAASPRLGGS